MFVLRRFLSQASRAESKKDLLKDQIRYTDLALSH
jgi:hypothetical protein